MIVSVLITIKGAISKVNIAIINRPGSNTNTLQSANGIPIVNINKPNQSGVSNNEYSNLDIGNEGLIFNNSGNLSSTQLAGWIMANNNLAVNEHTKLIVNTIQSKRSELNVYMEVAGAKSDLIILNQNGITCNGCGFINVNRGILSTEQASYDTNGALTGIKVTSGDVVIGRGGFNCIQTNRIDIIAQSLFLNGEISAKNININLGCQEYDYTSDMGKSINEGEPQNYVINSSEFGGIYGEGIRLITHEKSIGVAIDFNMATTGSNLTVNSAGDLVN